MRYDLLVHDRIDLLNQVLEAGGRGALGFSWRHTSSVPSECIIAMCAPTCLFYYLQNYLDMRVLTAVNVLLVVSTPVAMAPLNKSL